MLRSDLEKVIESVDQRPPTGPHPIQYNTGGIPVPNTGGVPVQRPVNKTRRLIILSIVGVLLLGVLGTGIWWFSSGRYTEVPTLTGQDSTVAQQAVRAANLSPHVTTVRDNKVAAGVVISSDPAAGVEALRGDEVNLVVSAGRPVVPDVPGGSTREDAEQAVRAEELQPQLDDSKNVYDDSITQGKVVKLDPPAGTALDIGQRVVLVLSKGPAPKPVPNVRGQTRDEAFRQLTQAGFQPYDGQPEFSPDIDSGRVVRTDPPPDTKIDSAGNMRVAVVISNSVAVPDITGRTIPEAQAILQQAGLQLDLQPFSNPNGRIFNQNPGPTTRVQSGSKVTAFAL
ncbi:Stk1 family PASTA domain-containing Ser/Thr kinase [Actinokineospora enzanensis]|uniref:Stk1 family PASTA domain-containing Ser/Thr kinase n=1 Tax=Actinokineospora enzanensis TaxID=155975 RepID=UPI001FDFF466|nr:Stk1 family PASTA domain-containing Ser/Thr kinase [Actinokineospora enzanensis]